MSEIPYVIISLFFICATLGVVFLVAWRAFGYPRHALTWSITFALASLQWGLNAAHSFQLIPIYNLYWVSVSFLGPVVPLLAVLGYRQRANKYLHIPLIVGAGLLSFGATLWYSMVQPHMGLRLAILPYTTMLTSIWVVWIVYNVPRKMRPIEWTLIVVYLVSAAIEFSLGTIALSQGAVPDEPTIALYLSVLFLSMPVIFSIGGVMALATIASDLAVQAEKAAENEIAAQRKETERSWHTLSDAIDAIPDLVALDDGHGNVVACNTAFSNLLGIPQETMAGQRTLDLMDKYWQQLESIDGEPVNSVQDFANRMWRSLTTGSQLHAVTKDKRNFIVDCGYVRGGGFIMVGRDVSQLAETRIRLEAAIHSAPIAFAFFDKDQRLVACNNTYEKMLGQKQEWLSEQPLKTIVRAFIRRLKIAKKQPLSVRSEWLNSYLDSVEARKIVHELALMEDGTWFEITSQPVAEGGYVTVASDITTRHLLERDLERNEAQLRQILEGQPFPVLVLSPTEKSILFASGAAIEALTGKADDADWSEIKDKLRQNSEVLPPILETTRTQTETISEVTLKRLNGDYFPALFSSQSVSYSGIEAYVVSFIDLSTIKGLERELEQQQQALFQSQKLNALGTLLAGVAHELNNPLTIVVANAHVLSMSNEDPELQSRIKKITDAAERCSGIVRSFLDVARKDSGNKSRFDLAACIKKSIELAELGFTDQEISVTADIDPNLPALEGSAEQIGQVIMNLVINAKQALAEQEGPKQVNISCRVNQALEKLEITVADNGPGIPSEIQSQIFDPFFTTKAVGQGTGMGLSLVHSIVTSHGGTIELTESNSRGACFRICLPHSGQPVSNEEMSTDSAKTVQSYRILVVDDEEDVLEALEDVLIIQGHDAIGVTTGEAALEALHSQQFDCIFSDLRMPGMNGEELYREIENQFPEMAPRTAFITGNNLSRSARAFLDHCKRPSLGKPFTPEQLTDILQDIGLG